MDKEQELKKWETLLMTHWGSIKTISARINEIKEGW